MEHLRWLLVMEKASDPNDDGFAYRLWLYELDEAAVTAPKACVTVDELMTALWARWDRDCLSHREG